MEYEPFRENTFAKSLDEPSTLRLQDNLPRLEGATALYPLYSAFARAVYPEDDYPVYSTGLFRSPNNNPVVTCSMTSGAFEKLIDGESDAIFLMGVSEEQWEMARERGLELKLTPIGREAFVFFVNKRNDISNLTVNDVRGIYSGRITNWSEVGGNNDEIRPYQRAENSGSQTMLMEIMGDTPLMTVPETDYYDLMYEIYRAVAVYKNYKNSLGYSFLYYVNTMIAENEIKLLSINGVEPTVANIANGTYPLASDFYAITVVREPDNEEEAERINNTEKLIEWILSPQGQSLVEKTGYVPFK
jgi:phosphate transport system substrate-binding protein